MSLPEAVRIKLSSEAAEAISLTPVLIRDIPLRELLEHMLGVVGKNEARIRELLRRGTLVSGASRFRWEGWDADVEGIRALLEGFPDADPALPFSPERCVRAILRGGRQAIDIPRQAGARKPLLRRRSFWDVLMEVAAGCECRYEDYSYRERADLYRMEIPVVHGDRLRAAAPALKYATLRQQIRTTAFVSADLYVERP